MSHHFFSPLNQFLSTCAPITATFSVSFATSSIVEPAILHGPHQDAQKSINTGLSDFKTSVRYTYGDRHYKFTTTI